MYDTSATYYIPAKMIETENGTRTPYGEFTQAYIGVIYDGKGYKYYWISNDTSKQGIKNVTPQDKLDEDLIEGDLNDTDIRTTVETTGIEGRSKILILGEDEKWEDERSAYDYIGGGTEAIFAKGSDVNSKMKILAGDDVSSVTNPYDFEDTKITEIRYSSVEPDDTKKQDDNIVSTSTSKYPIYMWYDNGIIYWWSEDKTPSLNQDSERMFFSMFSLRKIDGLANFDTRNVTSLRSFFNYDRSLSDVSPIKMWDVTKVTSTRMMFRDCRNLEVIDLSNWKTSSLINAEFMFGMSDRSGNIVTNKLKNIILSSNFDTSKVTNMQSMFLNNTSIEDYSFLQYFNTSNVTNMLSMFQNNYRLTNTYYMKNWDVSKVTSMVQMFCGCVNLIEVDLSRWNTKSLTHMYNMFAMWNPNGTARFDSKLKRIILSDKFDTSKVTSLECLLANNTMLEDYSFLQYFNTSNVTTMKQMFQFNNSLKNLEYLRNWDVSKVTDMRYMFTDTTSLTDSSAINDWNIISVTNFGNMFKNSPSHPTFTKINGTWSNGTFTPA